jgi:hypothetical protein
MYKDYFEPKFDGFSCILIHVPVLVVEEARVPGENHPPWASKW